MRIGFDTSPLVRPHPPGIVRVVRGAIQALERTPGITALRFEPKTGENLLAWRQASLPQLVREREIVGLHSFVSAFALAGPGRRVQTIHELPWRHRVRENSGLRHRFWAAIASRRADLIVCGSRFVAEELGRGTLAARVRVCPWGVDAHHFGLAPSAELLGEVRESLGISAASEDAPALLVALGAVRRKKNVAAVLHGMREHHRAGGSAVKLAISGEIGAQAREDQALARSLDLAGNVHWLGTLDESRLVALLHASSAAVVLSRSEGFGLPVLEAFAAGRTVIVARDTAQSEVAAGLGIEVNPDDAESVARGIQQAIEDDGRAPERRAQAALFSWERCAQRIAEIWREFA